jgi:hypothetical protein
MSNAKQRRQWDREKRQAAQVWRGQILPGAKFDTPFEKGCVITGELDEDFTFSFTALDSEGVECDFDIRMVTRIYS